MSTTKERQAARHDCRDQVRRGVVKPTRQVRYRTLRGYIHKDPTDRIALRPEPNTGPERYPTLAAALHDAGVS